MSLPSHLTCRPEDVARFRDWLANRGGLAYWQSQDMQTLDRSWTTPARTADGEPSGRPHWSCPLQPDMVVTDPALVRVDVAREVKRVRIAIQQNGHILALTGPASRRVCRAVEKAAQETGKEAWYVFEGAEAVILVADKSVPLLEWSEDVGESAPKN